jgi:hypothetical protein
MCSVGCKEPPHPQPQPTKLISALIYIRSLEANEFHFDHAFMARSYRVRIVFMSMLLFQLLRLLNLIIFI